MNSHLSDLNLAAPSRLLWLECLIQDLITL